MSARGSSDITHYGSPAPCTYYYFIIFICEIVQCELRAPGTVHCVIINDWSWIYFLPFASLRTQSSRRSNKAVCVCRECAQFFRHHCGHRRFTLCCRWWGINRPEKKILRFPVNKLPCIIYGSYSRMFVDCRTAHSPAFGWLLLLCSIVFCRMPAITASFRMRNNGSMWFS